MGVGELARFAETLQVELDPISEQALEHTVRSCKGWTGDRPLGTRIDCASVDVIHGFQIVGTNANTMVVPGYVSQFTTVFDEPGDYLIVCNPATKRSPKCDATTSGAGGGNHPHRRRHETRTSTWVDL